MAAVVNDSSVGLEQEKPFRRKAFLQPWLRFALQLTPSAFLKEMSLTTEQRLASTHSTRRPHIVQLLDMSDTSYQKVLFSCPFPCCLTWHFRSKYVRLAPGFSR